MIEEIWPLYWRGPTLPEWLQIEDRATGGSWLGVEVHPHQGAVAAIKSGKVSDHFGMVVDPLPVIPCDPENSPGLPRDSDSLSPIMRQPHIRQIVCPIGFGSTLPRQDRIDNMCPGWRNGRLVQSSRRSRSCSRACSRCSPRSQRPASKW
jgi:hypothetical protein